MKMRHQIVLAVAAASLVLAGCSDKDTSAKAGVPKTAGTELTAANFVTEVTAAQLKAKSSHIDMKIDTSGQKITAVGDIEVGAGATNTSIAMMMDLGSTGMGKLEVRLINQAFYINLGPMSQNKFAKIGLTDSSDPIGAQYGKLIDQLDPSKLITQFKGALSSMKKKGAAIELDGVKAQPYELTLDTSKLADISKLAGTANLPKEIVYTVFIGPDNLPRRIASEFSGAKATMDFSKWGESVDIKAPSKAEITDKSFLDQMGIRPAA